MSVDLVKEEDYIKGHDLWDGRGERFAVMQCVG